MYDGITFLEGIATSAQVGEDIDPKRWNEFMRKMGDPLARYRPDQLEAARAAWYRAYQQWLAKEQEQ